MLLINIIAVTIFVLWISGVIIASGIIFTDDSKLTNSDLIVITVWPIFLFSVICIIPFLPVIVPLYYIGYRIAKRT